METINSAFITSIEKSRAFFLRHLLGLSSEQVDWKPFPECKNILETIQHLIIDDRMAIESMQSMDEPNYGACLVTETDYDKLLEMLRESHQALIHYLKDRYVVETPDELGCAWGAIMPAPLAISYLASEDFYHAGQVAFIRQATDPSWDYYSNISGVSE